MDTRAELRDIIREQSILRRPEGYILASGKWSPYYFDLKLTTVSNPYALWLAARLMLEGIDILPMRPDAIGGLTTGAVPLVVAISLLANREGKTLPGFFVRDEQKTHGTERVIEGRVTDGMKVVIVDDVITTGGSVMKAIRPVEKQGAKVLHVLVLVDRGEGGIAALREQGYHAESIFTSGELLD
jgi:orotate phosphoribosyltransferase